MTQHHTQADRTEHTFLVAITVDGAATREAAEYWLHDHLPQPGIEFDVNGVTVESWWVAEDDRRDRSDCDSAVFVPKGYQHRTHL